MGIFSGCLLASDIDGTLLADKYINPRNIEKIEYFMSEGGYFSLATGRSVGAISMVLDQLKRVSPCIVANGTMIFDYEKDTDIHQEYIPEEDYKIIDLVSKLPFEVGIEVHAGKRVFTIKQTKETDDHQTYEKLETTVVSYDEIKDCKINKILFALNNTEDREILNEYLEQFRWESDFIDTIAFAYGKERYYIEQLPKGVSKASTILKLAEIMNIEKDKIFAIGDYYNDLQMIKTANIGAVTADAPDDVKQFADYIACSCVDGAVADFIDYLKEIRLKD